MKKCFTWTRWGVFIIMLSFAMVAKGYGHGLFETSLTVASSDSYLLEVEAKISVHDTGEVELSIEELRSADGQRINQSCILVIETEINDNPKTYSRSFTITEGKTKLEFTLEGLNKGDKLEIAHVVINKETSPTPTPEATASPTPTSSPFATPLVTPTPSLFRASTSLSVLVPGGIISKSAIPTPTPIATASPIPTAPPSVIQADVEIKPETINLKSNGKFKAFIKLGSDSLYDVNDIVTETVECEGAKAIDGKVDKNRFVATFNTQDLGLDSGINFYKGKKDENEKKEFTVTGELGDGFRFEGSDTVKVKGRNDDDGNDDDDHDNHEKKRHR